MGKSRKASKNNYAPQNAEAGNTRKGSTSMQNSTGNTPETAEGVNNRGSVPDQAMPNGPTVSLHSHTKIAPYKAADKDIHENGQIDPSCHEKGLPVDREEQVMPEARHKIRENCTSLSRESPRIGESLQNIRFNTSYPTMSEPPAFEELNKNDFQDQIDGQSKACSTFCSSKHYSAAHSKVPIRTNAIDSIAETQPPFCDETQQAATCQSPSADPQHFLFNYILRAPSPSPNKYECFPILGSNPNTSASERSSTLAVDNVECSNGAHSGCLTTSPSSQANAPGNATFTLTNIGTSFFNEAFKFCEELGKSILLTQTDSGYYLETI